MWGAGDRGNGDLHLVVKSMRIGLFQLIVIHPTEEQQLILRDTYNIIYGLNHSKTEAVYFCTVLLVIKIHADRN